MQQPTYDEQITMKNEMKLRELCAGLPAFCKEFFRGIEPTTSSRTRIAYAYDLKIFFHFLQEKYPDIEESDLKNWPVTVLDKVTLTQLEEYLDIYASMRMQKTKFILMKNEDVCEKQPVYGHFINFSTENKLLKIIQQAC